MAPTTTYAAVADVQALLPSASSTGITISGTSSPSTTQVEGFLDQVAAEINSVLVQIGYSVPVTGSNDIYMIKRFLSQKVAAMSFHAGYGVLSDPPSRITQWEKEYDTFIQRLIDRKQRLVDSAPRSKIGVIPVGRYVED